VRFKFPKAVVPLLVLLLFAAAFPTFASTAIITTGPCPTAAVGGSSICTDAVITASGGQIQFSLGMSSPWNVTGANPTNFSVVGDTSRGACSLGLVVPSGQSCYLLVYFFPSAAGTRTATIAPVLAIGTATSATLSGVGQNPGVAVVGVPSCATTTVGSSTSCGTATLTASGGPIEVTYTTPVYSLGGTNPGDFALGTPSSNACAAFEQLASGATCNLATVSFAPAATGSRSATLAVSTYLYGTAGSGTLSGTGINPQCTFTLSSSTSCSTPYGSPATCGSLTLSTSSSVCSSSVTSIAIAPLANFSQTNNCPATMAQGQTCTITPTYQGNTTAAVIGTVTVTTSSNNPTGTVAATPTFGVATVSTSGVTCPATGVGTSVSCTGNITVTATSAPIIFGPTLRSISGNTADFVLSTPTSGACSANQTLNTGASCNLASLTFNPTAAGSRSETITVTPANGSAGSATLSATGSYGVATVSVAGVTCSGTVGIASSCSGSAKITATNGPVVLNATPGVVSGTNAADFAISGGACASASLTINQSCTLGAIAFSAGGSGARAAVLSSSVLNGTTSTASLSGTGVAAGSASVSSVSCGSAGIGSSTACSGTVTVLATGGDIVLGGTPYSVSGAASEFTYAPASSGACAANQILRNGSSCNLIQISAFAPTAAGTRSLSVTVTASNGTSGSGVISGTGVYGAAVVSAAGVSCPGTGIGTHAACGGSLTVTATGGSIVFSRTLEVPTGDISDFTLGAPSTAPCSASQTLANGASCNLASVSFNPTAAGARSETLTVTPASGTSGSATLSAIGLYGTVALSTSSLDCGGVGAGLTARCGTLTLTAQNGAVTLAATPFVNSDSTDFTIPAGTCTGGRTLNADQTCISGPITFTPHSVATLSATVTVETIGGAGPAVAVTGIGTAGVASVTPTSLACAATTVGTPVSCGTVSVTAQGGPITLASTPLSLTGNPNYTVSAGTCVANQTLTVGQTCSTGAIVFDPSSAGTIAATLTISCGSGCSVAVALTGTGYTYAWQTGGWTPAAGSNCTASLTQTRTITCLRSDGAAVNAVNCNQATEPVSSQVLADFGGCTYDWQVGPWGVCSGGTAQWQYTSWLPSSGCGVTDQKRGASCSPDADSATQSRSVLCVRADGTTVANDSCNGTAQPASVESCTRVSGYSCGPSAPTEQSVLLTDMCSYAWIDGPWSAWSSSCSVDAIRSRSVQCQRSDGSIMDDASCDPETMPASADTGGNFIGCTYTWIASGFGACRGGTSSWLTGAWQPASGCGPVVQTRTLTCVADVNSGTATQTVTCQRLDGATVADNSCDVATKPAVNLGCTPGTPSCGAAPAPSQTVTLASTCPSGCTPNPADGRYCVMTPL